MQDVSPWLNASKINVPYEHISDSPDADLNVPNTVCNGVHSCTISIHFTYLLPFSVVHALQLDSVVVPRSYTKIA